MSPGDRRAPCSRRAWPANALVAIRPEGRARLRIGTGPQQKGRSDSQTALRKDLAQTAARRSQQMLEPHRREFAASAERVDWARPGRGVRGTREGTR